MEEKWKEKNGKWEKWTRQGAGVAFIKRRVDACGWTKTEQDILSTEYRTFEY